MRLRSDVCRMRRPKRNDDQRRGAEWSLRLAELKNAPAVTKAPAEKLLLTIHKFYRLNNFLLSKYIPKDDCLVSWFEASFPTSAPSWNPQPL